MADQTTTTDQPDAAGSPTVGGDSTLNSARRQSTDNEDPMIHDDTPATRADLARLEALVRHEHSRTREDNRTTRETLDRHAQAMADRSVAEDHDHRWGHHG